ncbi:MAG: bifunctional 23S rRNA (guanine(2069)-N(7))-methyltransferase RlmK/23S rRNA (guanine(2445)-N(2))-methyltransferase RlmL [Coriobacteriia bacterium]|nr:bifunctional 23S rRNA (guanine(2069)-N(7))-methyltransferase RlmK/23S rRNA (guanine(2445)-N(2))-methyltransferase RlmL [Coriobacteriia bacterium]
MKLTLFATCARGVESLLAEELSAIGARDVKAARAGVAFRGDIRTAYAACLWSRTASRVLMTLGQVPADTVDALYEGVRAMPWEDHISPDGTLAVDFASDTNPAFRNTMFGAQKVKDAIVDRLRDRFGHRPNVDPVAPDVRVNVRVRTGKATVSIDLAGDALHRRGYREAGVQGAAPLKESLAAAVLLFAGWREVAAAGGALLDPMCGSGTLLIEGAWIAGDVAPGLIRPYFGFTGWLGHDADAWADLLADADGRAEAGLAKLPPIVGSDSDPAAVELAVANLARAGLRGRVSAVQGAMERMLPPEGATTGLVAVNPPYGERIGERATLLSTYRMFGERLRHEFPGWRAAVLTDDDALASAVGLVPQESHRLYNGPIHVRLDVAPVPDAAVVDETAGAAAFGNRLRKGLKHLSKWAKREGVTCWRVYDADLPDFAVSVDLYDGEDGVRRAVVAEYEAPREIDPVKAAVRLSEAVAAVPAVLSMAETEVRVKVRRRQKGESQYERMGETGRFHVIREGDARLLVNLDDYLDTGLFLDHRITRRMVAELAEGRSLLNLFCYTGAVTVQAALAGATSSVSIDLSNTYLEWAKRNFELNGLDAKQHTLVRADATAWLSQAAANAAGARFGVVFLDPPSFSTSKAMEDTLDVQRDHVRLIRDAATLLELDGVLVFSTNLRSFKLDAAGLVGLRAQDVSPQTIPPDFERSPRIHRCYLIRR